MLDLSFSKSKDLGDMLRFLPGIVVQKDMSMKGMPVTPMADLYRIEPDLLECLVKCTMASFKPSPSRYRLDDYLPVISSITAILCFNISLFAVIFCHYYFLSLLKDPIPFKLTFSLMFSASFELSFS
jgi:hypothetical protein